MSHKMFDNVIVMCIKSGESDCCTFNDCALFQQCFPVAYADWQEMLVKEQQERNEVKA